MAPDQKMIKNQNKEMSRTGNLPLLHRGRFLIQPLRLCFSIHEGGAVDYRLQRAVYIRLLNRGFEQRVLQAIFDHEKEHRSLMAFPNHPIGWGWVSRKEIARRAGYPECPKTLSRKIRQALIWLPGEGYIRFKDVNIPGKKHGATRFLILFRFIQVINRLVENSKRGLSRTLRKIMETSRTKKLERPPGWKPPDRFMTSKIVQGWIERGLLKWEREQFTG